jgi:hypothetical protein
MELENIRNIIEKMSKEQHIELAQILISHHKVEHDENQNGIFINLINLKQDVITDIQQFIKKHSLALPRLEDLA